MVELLNFVLVAAISVVALKVAAPPSMAFYALLLKLGYHPGTALLIVSLNLFTGFLAGTGLLGMTGPLVRLFIPDLPLWLYDVMPPAGLALLLMSFQIKRSIGKWTEI